MKGLIQRVTQASVTVDGFTVGRIGRGLLLLLGVEDSDNAERAVRLLDRVLNYRVFPDDEDRMNRSLLDCGGELLIVSQFTLAADTRKGRRPGFSTAAPPDLGEALYEEFVVLARTRLGNRLQTGRFGASMQVSLVNDGPVTFLLES